MTSDVTETTALQVIDKLMELIRIENEENDILIVKTVMDFMRHNPKVMTKRVQSFLDIIVEMFQMMHKTVQEVFDSPATNGTPAVPSTPGAHYNQSPRPSSPISTSTSDLGTEQQQARHLQKGMQSFKVLAECPIIVVGIFTSADRSVVQRNVKEFVSQIKNTLMLQARPQEKAHEEAKLRGDIHTGICKEIKNKTAFGDFILMQVKTMSFLAYLLRVYSGQLTDFLPSLPDIVVRMLKDCPRERSAARKELLVAIRHIINFNFRKIFLKKLDELLDARILIGDGLTVYETMRPLAYSMLADLIHHLREFLTKDQIRKAIQVYVQNFHDDFPGTSFQTMSAKLLINMADCIAKVEPKEDARHFFMMIFNAIADKFAAMNDQFKNAVKLSGHPIVPPGDLITDNYLADKNNPPDWDDISIYNATPIKTQNPRERTSNLVNDNKFLLKNLVQGLKNLFAVLKNTNPSALKPENDASAFPVNWNELSFGFSAEEVQIFIKLFHEGIQVFRYYDHSGTASSQDTANLTTAELLATQYMMHGSKEEKDLLETFGTVFHYIDPATFHEIFYLEIPHLYDMCFLHPPLLHIAQFLLASEATSPSFCGMLLQFLMGKLGEVGVADVKKASSLLRLFKLSFMAVTLFAAQNEQVLLPHTTKIITQSIQLSTTAEDPINYFLLLRSLFRSIGGGKFEMLYKEILPLLEMILDVLNGLLHSARKPSDRDLFVELILTVPARLSNLLPHLSYLMRPLIVALGSGSDLVGQGLRTVELCVDNFTENYIDPIMAPFIDELMPVLWEHLKPAPYNHYHSHTTMRILGKLGGRNRKFINDINQLKYKTYSDDDSSYDIKLIGSNRDRAFPANIGIDMAIAKLKENPSKIKDSQKAAAAKASDPFHKRQSFHFIQAQVKLFLGLDNLPDDFAALVRIQVSDLLTGKFEVGEDILTLLERDKSVTKRDAQHDILKKLLQTCHYVHSIDFLKDEAAAFVLNLCHHFMLLEVGKTFAMYKNRPKPFSANVGQGPLFIDSKVMADAISDSLASDSPEEREAAEVSMLALWEAGGVILGNKEKIDRLPFFVQLVKNFTHSCYQEEWFTKMSGVLGLQILITKLPFSDAWLLDKHLEIVRALMFVLKDMSPDNTAMPRVEAEAILQLLIPKVAKNFTAEDLTKDQSRFRSLNKTLIQDLSHSNRNARQAVQKLYKILADTVKMEVADVLKPSKEVLLTPIFNKPIRTIPLGHQIGCLDALNFCMKLESKIIPHDDVLNRLVQEVALLLDAEDEALSPKPNEYRNTESIVQLRSSCMRLLTTVITTPENTIMAPNSTLWNRIITVFFKWLYVKNPDVVEAAREALKAVIAVNNRLPKEVLQNGLKPILTSLQEWRKLTVESLEGLGKLLKLLTTYFKVEIGQRLLDHTVHLIDANTLQKASFALLDGSRPLRVLAALFNVFHLLPLTADKYLQEIVEKIIDLESALRRTRFSPFREPLVRFLNLYPKSTLDYFYPKLQDLKYGRFFAQILAHSNAAPLRDAVYASAGRLVTEITADANEKASAAYTKAIKDARDNVATAQQQALGSGDGADQKVVPMEINPEEDIAKPDPVSDQEIKKLRLTGTVNGIHIAHALSKFTKTRDFMFKNDTLRKSLFTNGQDLERQLRESEKPVDQNDEEDEEAASSTMTIDTVLRLAAEQAGEQIIDLLLITLEEKPDNFDFFFEVVDAVASGRLKTTPSLFKFIYRVMLCSESEGYWKSMVLFCIEKYRRPTISHKVKSFLFHNVVNPIFAMDVQRNWESLFTDNKGTKLFDRSMLVTINDKLWKPNSGDGGEDLVDYIDHSRQELLQLTALLLKYHEGLMQTERKEVIKFAWNLIRLEDVVNKHAAYVVIAYFIHFYDTPAKITMTVYQSLLKAHQNEGRPLVTEALELLAPVLKKRVGNVDQQHILPVWARLPKKIMAEEINNLQQIISIFNFFCRQPDLFYEARDSLAPAIIPHLAKVAQSNNEGKRASLNLASLIWTWEERAYQEKFGSPTGSPMRGIKRKSDGSPVQKPEGEEVPNDNSSWSCVSSPQLRSILIRHLSQFASHLLERYPIPSAKLRESFHLANQAPVQPSEFSRRAVHLLQKFLSPPFWSDVDFDHIIPRIVTQILVKPKPDEEKKDAWETKMINTLQVLKVFINLKSDEWIIDEIGNLSNYIAKVMKMEDPQFQDCLHSEGDEKDKGTTPLFRRLIDALPPAPTMEGEEPDDTPAATFLTSVHTAITEALSNKHLFSGINMLYTLCNARPKEVDQHMEGLLKVFNTHMVKDHLQTQAQALSQQPPGGRTESSQGQAANQELYENELQTGLILKVIDIMAARIESLGENRRPFLTTLANLLIEKSRSEVVCSKILDLVESWVFNSDGVPTLKEKVAVLSKMLTFESRPEIANLHKRFLTLVLRIYEDPRVTRTELTVRLEHPFLIGMRSTDVDLRNKFLSIFDRHISRTPNVRLDSLLCGQDWSPLGDTFWLSQVIYLLCGSLELNSPIQLHKEDFKTLSPLRYFGSFDKDSRLGDIIVDDAFTDWINNYKKFASEVIDVKLRDVMEPLSQLQHTDQELASRIWIALFPIFWSNIPKDERPEFENNIANVLTRDFHHRQLELRPNCVQTLVESIVRSKPRLKCPPHIIKYLAKTYNVWYPAAHYLEQAAIDPLADTAAVRESTLDALLDVYASLDETDMFYGTWRRRCQYVETNAALSYEQIGMWDRAQQMYETAQVKARTGALAFSQGEYSLWEDHWVICGQKLQQWDILSEYAKHENFNDLYIEAMWRNPDHWVDQNEREQFDSMIKSVSDALTPRRAFFQAFMAFLKLHWSKSEDRSEFTRCVDDAIQISIRKWHQLPDRITNAHIPLLQNFQHLVELYDAQAVTVVLHTANLANLDSKSQELRHLFQGWRDRLPNFWDDINAWQDLVTWRTHIFTLVNKIFLPIINATNQGNQGNPSQYSFAYRGYHEMAWIINRFAHVARQHNLTDVSAHHLNKIYTLPNIEIQEAFIKLREQAKCHYQKDELNSGLDVINNTNLNYFSANQKSEFYTLKGMFLNKLGQKAEANEAFGCSLYFDIRLPKAWAEWARYNDQLLKEDPKDLSKAAAAIACYLEAASCYKNKKSRKLLGRVLWLLGLDNAERLCAKAMADFKSEQPYWYWITFIPQLLLSLSRPEANIARGLLSHIAKMYPQALHFQLRTSREDLIQIKRQQEVKEQREKAAKANQEKAKAGGTQGSPPAQAATPAAAQTPQQTSTQGSPKLDATPTSRPGTANGVADGDANPAATPKLSSSPPKADGAEANMSATPTSETPLKPWEHADQVMNSLKSSHALLFFSMESMVENLTRNLKGHPDEDAHRLIVALLNDGLNYLGRQPALFANDSKLPTTTELNISRFAESVCPPHVRKQFEQDFVKVKPSMKEYIEKLRKWRTRLEERLDRRQTPANLENLTPILIEFPFHKLDEVEIPGQYLEHKDKNTDFIRVDRFLPDVELVRGAQVSFRRIKIRGHDGSLHSFAVQTPTARYCRREERILQLFRLFNDTLLKKRETRRRHLTFNLPLTVPLSPAVRLVQDDTSNVTLQSVYEDWCRKNSVQKDDPILFHIGKLSEIPAAQLQRNPLNKNISDEEKKQNEAIAQMKLETFFAIQENMVPSTVVLDYFQSIYPSFSDFWLFRRTFSYQLAALSVINYIMFMNSRQPHKFTISRSTGKVCGSELHPAMGNMRPLFNQPDPVSIRLTPNIQMLMGPLVTEGVFAPSIMAIARALTEPDGDLELQLSLFVRDEVQYWFSAQPRAAQQLAQEHGGVESVLRQTVQQNSDQVIRKAMSLARTPEGANLPANQTIVDLVSQSVNPRNLSACDPLWMAWL
jgi:transformation/transcription domain-associated protein